MGTKYANLYHTLIVDGFLFLSLAPAISRRLRIDGFENVSNALFVIYFLSSDFWMTPSPLFPSNVFSFHSFHVWMRAPSKSITFGQITFTWFHLTSFAKFCINDEIKCEWMKKKLDSIRWSPWQQFNLAYLVVFFFRLIKLSLATIFNCASVQHHSGRQTPRWRTKMNQKANGKKIKSFSGSFSVWCAKRKTRFQKSIDVVATKPSEIHFLDGGIMQFI